MAVSEESKGCIRICDCNIEDTRLTGNTLGNTARERGVSSYKSKDTGVVLIVNLPFCIYIHKHIFLVNPYLFLNYFKLSNLDLCMVKYVL